MNTMMYDKIMSGEVDAFYRKAAKLPNVRKLMKDCLAQNARQRAALRKAEVYSYDDKASFRAGQESINTIYDADENLTDDVLRQVLATVLVLDRPVFIEFALQVMLDGIQNAGGAMFDPKMPRHQKRAGFLYTPNGGHIRAAMWVEDYPDADASPGSALIALPDPVCAVIGARGSDSLSVSDVHQNLALGLVEATPFMDRSFGLVPNGPEYAAMAALQKGDMLHTLKDRAGIARRALFLLAGVLRPRETICLDPVLHVGSNVRIGRKWATQVRNVVMRLDDPRVTSASTGHTGIRMPEHPVRGHWRTYKACACVLSSWQDVAPRRQVCTTCGARRTFVESHVRGDPAIGTVTRGVHEIRV